jgi:hypothetical protein
VRFIDTSVLLSAVSRDPAEQDKTQRANDILADRDLALSVQVLHEFYVQATRASRPDPITHQQAVRLIGSFRRFPVQDMTSAILMAAWTRASGSSSRTGTPRSSRHPARWAARKSCQKIWAMARTTPESGSPTRSAEARRLHSAQACRLSSPRRNSTEPKDFFEFIVGLLLPLWG